MHHYLIHINHYSLFALASFPLSLARYGTYIYSIFAGDTRPHSFTWLLRAVLSAMAAFAQWKLGGGPSVWILALIAASCLVIAIIGFFVKDHQYARSDWMAVILSVALIAISYAVHHPVITVIISASVQAAVFWPTIRKSHDSPQTEPPISYGISVTRYGFMVFAIPHPDWETLLYPVFMIVFEGGFALYIVWRRWRLGYPLHEFTGQRARG